MLVQSLKKKNCGVKLGGNGILGLSLGHFGNHDNRQQIACRREYFGIKKKRGGGGGAESWMINQEENTKLFTSKLVFKYCV